MREPRLEREPYDVREPEDVRGAKQMTTQTLCYKCGKPIDMDNEKYAVLWGPSDREASIAGFLHMACSEEYQDITDEVMQSK
jgi:hypothetical protein